MAAPDITQVLAGCQLLDAEPHAFKGDLRQALRLDAGFADEEHAARVTVEAVLDYRDVDIHGVAGFQLSFPGDAVAYDVVD